MKEHKSGYTIVCDKLKKKEAELAVQSAELEQLRQAMACLKSELDGVTNELNNARRLFNASDASNTTRIKELEQTLQRAKDAMQRQRDITGRYAERERWLYRHCPLIIRLWYLRHFAQ